MSSSGGLAEGGGGEAVDLAQRALRELAQHGERVVGDQGPVAADGVEPEAEVLGGIGDGGRGEAVVNAREQRAVGAAREVGFELGQAHRTSTSDNRALVSHSWRRVSPAKKRLAAVAEA